MDGSPVQNCRNQDAAFTMGEWRETQLLFAKASLERIQTLGIHYRLCHFLVNPGRDRNSAGRNLISWQASFINGMCQDWDMELTAPSPASSIPCHNSWNDHVSLFAPRHDLRSCHELTKGNLVKQWQLYCCVLFSSWVWKSHVSHGLNS